SQQHYLMTFGYLPQSDFEIGNLRTEEELINAIKEMQTFAGIPATGKIDEKTLKLMHTPRCGLPDVDKSFGGDRTRPKRYLLQGQRWPRTALTWTITNFTKDLAEEDVRNQLGRALSIWAKESKLTFTYIPTYAVKNAENEADIVVSFHKGYHEDGYPFDGEGAILAHAFFPGTGRGGDAHFDDEERWKGKRIDGTEGTMSLFAVAAHEFGHSLGLSHSSVDTALMYPWYRGFSDNTPLPTDDKYGIQQLYGRNEDSPDVDTLPTFRTRIPPSGVLTTTTTSTTAAPRVDTNDVGLPTLPPGRPDLCDTVYDAVAVIREELYVFRGPYFWRKGKQGIYSETPTEITRFWYGLPENTTHIDAIYERLDQRIVIFVGKQYWVFKDNSQEPGYPKSLTALWLPKDLERIDAAMVWGHNSKTYFFSGTMYWRYDEDAGHVELDYPRDMSTWQGIPYHIDAATQFTDGKTYFFKDKSYYEFDDLRFRAKNRGVPYLSAPFWLGCPTRAEMPKLQSVPQNLNEDDGDDWAVDNPGGRRYVAGGASLPRLLSSSWPHSAAVVVVVSIGLVTSTAAGFV
ncbi:unnamed protein product, partial [Notodromas monacha]